jgi:hypothetical protein
MRDAPAPSKLGIALCSAALLMLALLSFASAPASAATGRSLLRTLATGPGSNPRGLASDNDGNVYVLELGGPGSQSGVAKFDSAGNPVPFTASGDYISGNKLTGAPGKPFIFESFLLPEVAIDRSGGPNDGYIYVANTYLDPAVYVFDPTGTYRGAFDSVGSHELMCGVASSPAAGEVYTTSYGDELVRRFAPPSGSISHVREAKPNGRLKLPGNCGPVAVDSTGAAYVGLEGVTKFGASQFEAPTPTGNIVDPDTATALTVDPGNDDLFIDKGDRVVQRTATGAQVGSPFPSTPLQSSGVATGQSGELYVSEGNGGDGGVFVFGPDDVDLPLATTSGPSNIAYSSADVAGEADPDGTGDITSCEFRFGRDAGYSEGSVPCTPAASSGSPITSATPVSAALTGLQAGTHYHYRLFIENANGTVAGADQTLDTAIAVQGLATGEATEVTKESAELGGSYEGDGQDTHYYFQYGTTTSYGQTAPTPPGEDAGSGSGPQVLAPIAIGGLKGGTEYHYRVVASNAFGVTFGEDRTFTTLPAVANLTTEAATAITNEGAELNGSFDADKYDVHYYFEYGPTTAYGQVAPALPGNEVSTTTGNVKVTPVAISGLQPGGTYHFRIVATNAVGKSFGPDEVLTTANAPAITNLSSRNVKANSAELTAIINPQGGDTAYHFEYGLTTDYGTSVPIPDEDIGAGNTDVSVSALLSDLTSGITYHFRVVAQSPYGAAVSGDQTFGFYPPACPNSHLRQETGSNNLPDCRAYELASPSNSGGATIFPTAGPSTGYATSPAHIAFAAGLGKIPGSGDPINSAGDLYVSTRTSNGWYTKYIGLAANETLEMGGPPESYRTAVWDHGTIEAQRGVLSSPNMDRILNYNDEPPGGYPGIEVPPPSNAPYVWDSSTNTQVARWPTNLAEVEHGEEFIGTPIASADFTHFVFSSDTVFAQGGEAVTITHKSGNGGFIPCCAAPIYDNNTVTGTVKHISVKEDKETSFIGIPLYASTDGSNIVMAETANTSIFVETPLFVWVSAVGHTYDIAPEHNVRFEGATADGKTVYLSSTQQLTADDHDGSRDLFMWQESNPKELTRISVGSGGAGDSDSCSVSWTGGCGIETISVKLKRFEIGANYPDVLNGQGGNGVTDSPIASKSGDIYFESPEQLDGAKGEVGQVNLYVYRHGEVKFVTKLNNTKLCTEIPPENRCSDGPIARMQVTPDGKYAGFITPSRVTSYDNAGKAEMYRYSAASGQLICVSCLPSGKQPTADVYGSQNGLFLIDDGRIGFSTNDALVSQDTDEGNDTYEFAEGRPYLISSGLTAPHDQYGNGYDEGRTTPGLVGMSANGVDFYFASYDHLVTQDHNGQEVKIYDARTNGGFPAEVPAPNCQAADECHGAGSTPPPAMADRTSASQGAPVRAKAHKHQKKHAKHQKKKRANHKKQKRAAKNRSGR